MVSRKKKDKRTRGEKKTKWKIIIKGSHTCLYTTIVCTTCVCERKVCFIIMLFILCVVGTYNISNCLFLFQFNQSERKSHVCIINMTLFVHVRRFVYLFLLFFLLFFFISFPPLLSMSRLYTTIPIIIFFPFRFILPFF